MLAAAILGVMVIGGMTNELVVAKTALKKLVVVSQLHRFKVY